MPTYIIRFMGNDGEMNEEEQPGMLEAMQFIISNKIKGAKVKKSNGTQWDDADNLIEGFTKLFEPV